MFLFYHSKQTSIPDNASYYKGILFEELLKEFLNERGYDVTLRITKNGAEYDIDGKDRTTGFKIIGEAKAYSEKITIEKFSAFIGKFNPLGIDTSDIRGLFLSTSHLTPEAKEFYTKIREKKDSVIVIAGGELFENIKKEFNLVASINLQNRLTRQRYVIRTDGILMSDLGKFLVLICSSPESVNPSFFLLVNQNGDEISDDKFILKIKQNVKDFKDLSYIKINDRNDFRFERKIERGLLVGNSWIDYRLPAAPQCFVGRESICTEIFDHIENDSQQNIIQIKSRSGEGKSSLLSFLDMNFSKKNIHTELHDARDIKSILNIFVIVQRFTNSSFLPNNFEDVEKQIETLYGSKKINKAVIMIDQFESTFTNPDVFNAYENLISIIFNYRTKIYLILARKSDQLTTYDDREISINKINSLSISLELVDFNKVEAKTLIEKINEDSNNRISNEVKSYVLGFASGFPWLLKRTMAHIIKMIGLGSTQKELLDRSLRLEDLFNEELRGLEENEKGFLKRIANFLPATIDELEYKFNEDRLFRKKIDKLTTGKLLRLTGETYDTYNDVFKEYLRTGKIPEYHPPNIYRISPNSVLRLFHDLIVSRKPVFPIEDIQELSRTTKGYSFNLIKELSNLNLFKSSVENYWEIPEIVKDFYKGNRLGEYIRNQLIENDLVIKLKNHLEVKKTLTIQTLPDFLSELFPFIEANEKTWVAYSNFLINWLELTKIIVIGQNDELYIPLEEREKIIEELGNLIDVYPSGRRYNAEFFPTTSFKNVEDCFLLISNDITQIKNADQKALTDLKNGGWLINNALNVKSLDELKKQAVERIKTENHNKIWQAAENEEFLFETFKESFGESYSEETNKWHLRKLVNWGKSLGIIPARRYKYFERKHKLESQKTLRKREAKNALPQELKVKKKLLSEFVWDTHYKELGTYINKNKDSCVPRNGSTKTLGYWVTGIRTKRKRKLLSEEKIDLLNQINFDWDPIKNIWDKRYRDLLRFKEEYGHTHVPKDYDDKLHFWVKNQRSNIYRGSISPEQKELLLKIGVLDKYTPTQTALIPLDTMNLLNEFHSKHGHINVPQLDKEYKNLGRWINDQRVMRKRGKIKKERETLLEEMGIVWDTKENNWEKKLSELEKFYIKSGHFNVPRRDRDFPGLGKWVYDLRSNRPSAGRLKKLLKIGFDWDKEKLKDKV